LSVALYLDFDFLNQISCCHWCVFLGVIWSTRRYVVMSAS